MSIESPIHAEPAPAGASRPRSPVAWAVVGVTVLSLGGWFAVRLRTTLHTQEALASERAQVARQAAAAPAKSATAPSLATPVALSWLPEVQFEGTLQPVREADLGFKLSGRLLQIKVKLGDR